MEEGKLWLDMVVFFFFDKMPIWIINLLYFSKTCELSLNQYILEDIFLKMLVDCVCIYIIPTNIGLLEVTTIYSHT